MSVYQAKITFIAGHSQPDEYDSLTETKPANSFVVSRNKKGEVLSVYGDMRWDRSPYDPQNKPYGLNFCFWNKGDPTPERLRLVDEIKWLMFMLIYLAPGRPLTNGGLHGYISLLRKLARHAELGSITLVDVLISEKELITALGNPGRLKLCRALINSIHWLGPKLTGYNLDAPDLIKNLSKAVRGYRDTIRQTVPIPTRIYSTILANIASELRDVEAVLERLLELLKDYCSHPLAGLEYHSQIEEARRYGWVLPTHTTASPNFLDLLLKHDLKDFWNQKGLQAEGKGLLKLLGRIQTFASLQIQAFSGMRGDEADNLPYHCFEEQIRDGDNRKHFIVKGRVTKDSGSIRQAQWVTSSSGYTAIRLGQMISKTIYAILGDPPGDKQSFGDKHYLFIRSSAVLIKGTTPLPIQVDLAAISELRDSISATIEREDLEELFRIDGHRRWELEDDFQVGKIWRLKRHQFRRSLALYANASGLVSLPSLKRQLQHITEEMTLYYYEGSTFANNFIGNNAGDGNYFGNEWRKTKPISEGLAYIAHVLLADQADLFGPHALWNQLHKVDAGGNILVNREATLKAVKKGLLGYKPTPLGGCAKSGPCEKTPISLLQTDCLTTPCKHAIGNFKKLDRVIHIKSIQVEKLKIIDSEFF